MAKSNVQERPRSARQLGAPLDEATLARLRALIDEHGDKRVAELFGMHRLPLARAVAGWRLWSGTRAQIAAGLEKHS